MAASPAPQLEHDPLDGSDQRELGLSAADHKALGIIAGSGAMTAGQLADRTGMSPAAVTGLIDRLEGAGLVRRARDPADRRRVIVEPVEDQRADTARGCSPSCRSRWHR